MEKDKSRDSELIEGFYSKDQMESLFKDKEKKKMYIYLFFDIKNRIDSLKALIAGWVDKIYEYTHEIYLQDQKEKEKKVKSLKEL